MRGSRGSTVGGGNVVKPPLTLQLEDAKTQGFSSYSNTYPFNYLFGDKELLARQVGVASSAPYTLHTCTVIEYSICTSV